MDRKTYRQELGKLTDHAHNLAAEVHALMQQIDTPGSAEWSFLYTVSSSMTSVCGALYGAYLPRESALTDHTEPAALVHPAHEANPF